MSDAVLIEARESALGPPRPAPYRGWLSSRVGGALAGLGIGLVAVALRLYELRDVPRLTDETDEVMQGLAVARGELLPLTNVDAYIGPLWSYLLGLGFLVVGPTSLLPRVLTLLAALATVVAAAWLGRELAHRLGRPDWASSVGLGSALLLATSSFHAVVSSRIAWSHALTPLAMTAALACLLRWERTRSDRWLAGLGLVYGMAVHTHPTALGFAPGLGIWALLRWWETIARRGGWIALGLFMLANIPMLAFNVATGFTSAAAAARVQSAYAGGATTSFEGYLRNLGALLTSLPLLLAGEIGERRGEAFALAGPVPFVFAALFLVSLVVAARRRLLLPMLLFASAALVLPIFNGKYEPLFNGRYLAPLLPLGFVLMVLAAVAAAERTSIPRTWRGAAVAAALVLLAAVPVASLYRYVGATLATGPSNHELYRAVEIVAAAGSAKPVLVDATLSGTRHSTGREGTGVLEYLLILDGRVAVRRYQPNDLAAAVERGESDLVVVSPRLLTRLDKDFITEAPPGEAEARGRRRAGFVIARIVDRAEDTPDIGLVASDRSDR